MRAIICHHGADVTPQINKLFKLFNYLCQYMTQSKVFKHLFYSDFIL